MKDLKVIRNTTKREDWLKEGWEYIEKEFVGLRLEQLEQSKVAGATPSNAVSELAVDGEGEMVVEIVGGVESADGSRTVDLGEFEDWKRFAVKSWQRELEGKVQLEAGSTISMMMLWQHMDVLDWWRRHEGQFPTIALLARRYLCCPAAQSFQERVFSGGKIVMSAKRSRLDSGLFEQLVVLRHNQKWLQRLRDVKARGNSQTSAAKKAKTDK